MCCLWRCFWLWFYNNKLKCSSPLEHLFLQWLVLSHLLGLFHHFAGFPAAGLVCFPCFCGYVWLLVVQNINKNELSPERIAVFVRFACVCVDFFFFTMPLITLVSVRVVLSTEQDSVFSKECSPQYGTAVIVCCISYKYCTNCTRAWMSSDPNREMIVLRGTISYSPLEGWDQWTGKCLSNAMKRALAAVSMNDCWRGTQPIFLLYW